MNRSALIREICKILLCAMFVVVGIWAIRSGKADYEAVVAAAPVFEGFYHYLLGLVAIICAAVLWLLLTFSDLAEDVGRLEKRVEELEREWKDCGIEDDDDEVGYA